jgi:2-amino-4-hydroxy-6-hydroxymethyldihydropteridine diphosphokinase
MATTTYAIAIGSNRRSRRGAPEAAVRAAIAAIGAHRAAPILASAPVGPSIRRFANTTALVESDLPPPAMLAKLKTIERAFGRRRGRRWGARVIDLDIILWSGSHWRSPTLTVPHAAFRHRDFVLAPLAALVPGWRDPVTGLAIRHLLSRLTRPRPMPRSGASGAGP